MPAGMSCNGMILLIEPASMADFFNQFLEIYHRMVAFGMPKMSEDESRQVQNRPQRDKLYVFHRIE